MALPFLTIIDQPTTPNNAYTKLLFRVSGSSHQQPVQVYNQKYIMDIYKNGDKIFQMQAPANAPNNFAIFDASTIIQGSLDYDINQKSNAITMESDPTEVIAEFQFKFGQSLSFSPSSPSFTFNGLPLNEGGGIGEPALTSSIITIFKGAVDPALNNSWNFPSSSFNSSSFTSENISGTEYAQLRGPRLSNYPYGYEITNGITQPKPINTVDYETIGLLSEGFDPAYFQQATIEIYTSSSFSALPVYTASIYQTTVLQDRLYALGVGPANLSDQSVILKSYFDDTANPWTAYSIRVFYLNPGVQQYIADYWYVNDEQCGGFYSDGLIIAPPAPGLGTWTTKANLPQVLERTQGAGISAESAWSVGGGSRYSDPAIPDVSFSGIHIQYNGSIWAYAPTMPIAVYDANNLGSQTAGLIAFGFQDTNVFPTNRYSYLFNGTTFISQAITNVRRGNAAGAGNATSAIIWGGGTGGNERTSEQWDGSVWSFGPNLATNWAGLSSPGTSTSAISAGFSPGSINPNYGWNGIAFYVIPQTNSLGHKSTGAGTSNSSALIYGGNTSVNFEIVLRNEYFDGNSWTSLANMNYPVFQGMGAGTATNALSFGGTNYSGSSGGGFTPYQSINTSTQFNFTIPTQPTQVGPVINWIPNVNQNGDKTRFAFINQYGTWDYHTIYLPESKVTKVKSREKVDLSQVNYGNVAPVYDYSKRGTTQYYLQTEDTIEIDTNWLTTEEAEWLKELIESPSVFIQEFVANELNDVEFIPIVIKNTNYISKTNPRGQKTFKYTIRYQFSNQRRSRI